MAIAKVINTEDGQIIAVPQDCFLSCDEVVIVQRGESYLITPKDIAMKRFNNSIGSFDDSFFSAMEDIELENRIQTQALQEYYDLKKKEPEILEQEQRKAI